jgi:hypothetical protein
MQIRIRSMEVSSDWATAIKKSLLAGTVRGATNVGACHRATYILLHPLPRASKTDASQSWIEPGNSCTTGEQSMQRAIRTALLTAGTTKVFYHLAEHKKKYFLEDYYA